MTFRRQLVVALLLGALALGLGGTIAWRAAHPPETGPEVVVAALRGDDVRSVAVAGRWTLARRDGGWWISADGVDGVADPDAAARLLDAVARAGRGLPVVGDPATYGLDAPVVVEVVSGAGTTRLEVGAAAPVGDRTYVRAADGRIVAARSAIGGLARAPATAFAAPDRAPTPTDQNAPPEGSPGR